MLNIPEYLYETARSMQSYFYVFLLKTCIIIPVNRSIGKRMKIAFSISVKTLSIT